MHIVGVMLIHNEDVWLDRAIKNIREFCDRIIVIDNRSTDGSIEIIRKSPAPIATIIHEPDLRRTHEILHSYISTDAWIFGVDGDEIYDPSGLWNLRLAILSGELNNNFQIAGRYLHVTEITDHRATGYMGPPAHTPTKLYNFAALKAWPSDHEHSIFHARTREIKPGIKERDTRYQRRPWDFCPLKCLHMRFLRRSSIEDEQIAGARLSGEDTLGFGSRHDRGGHDDRNLRMSYQVGELITVNGRTFGI